MQCFPIQFYSSFLNYNICCKLAAAEILQTALMTNLQQCDIDSTQKKIGINILRISFPLLDMASPFDRNGHLFFCQISHNL